MRIRVPVWFMPVDELLSLIRNKETTTMTNEILASSVEAAAKSAGLMVVGSEPGESVDGTKTTKFAVAAADDTTRTLQLELSERFDGARQELAAGLGSYFAELRKRLKNPRPDCYYTMLGLPLSFGRFEWPFHESRSGADTSLVHGEVRLEEGGGEATLHAKVAVSMTLTFREVVPAPEQPFAEGFIYNAVRKTMDQGQLELVKSGNRQPVPLTTGYYSVKPTVLASRRSSPATGPSVARCTRLAPARLSLVTSCARAPPQPSATVSAHAIHLPAIRLPPMLKRSTPR